MNSSRDRYLVEVRDSEGKLDFEGEDHAREAHPYLFSKEYFSIDELCYFASYGEGRNKGIGPMELPAFMKSIGVSYRNMKSIGVSYRKKTW
jgi:hypothetical protein